MGRPPVDEWQILDQCEDPTPGDPYEVRDQATRLGRMGQSIRDQVRLLKNIAADDNISKGRYADKLRSSAQELESGLGTLATRYERVSGYLRGWADDLEYCQSESLKALRKAQDAAPVANAPHMEPGPGHSQQPLTPQQEQQQAAAKHTRQLARDDLAAAKAQLQNTIAHYGERGYSWMQKIEDAEHDGLKDHGFTEWLSNEIHEHAALIKAVSDALTWVVTALVIASMFIPFVDIGAAILFGIMAVALAGHTALALNGDGSWTDVAMDIVALATIGWGGFAKAGLSASGKVAGRIIAAAGDGEEGEAAAAKGLSEGAESTGSETMESTSRADSKVASYKEYLGNVVKGRGEPEAAENFSKIQRALELKPDGRWASRVADQYGHQYRVARGASVIGNTADQVGHWGGKSDLINFGGNLVSGHGFENGDIFHPNVEGDYAPSLKSMNDFKQLTTIGINGFTGD